MEADPIGLQTGLNLYAYVDNNPNTFFDRFGLAKQKTNCSKEPECKWEPLSYRACSKDCDKTKRNVLDFAEQYNTVKLIACALQGGSKIKPDSDDIEGIAAAGKATGCLIEAKEQYNKLLQDAALDYEKCVKKCRKDYLCE